MEKKKCCYNWEPESVHPESAVGNVIRYAKVEATKESTKAKMVSIEGEDGRIVEEGEGYYLLASVCGSVHNQMGIIF